MASCGGGVGDCVETEPFMFSGRKCSFHTHTSSAYTNSVTSRLCLHANNDLSRCSKTDWIKTPTYIRRPKTRIDCNYTELHTCVVYTYERQKLINVINQRTKCESLTLSSTQIYTSSLHIGIDILFMHMRIAAVGHVFWIRHVCNNYPSYKMCFLPY